MKPGYRQFCAIARTLDVVGQRWTLLVVRELSLRGPLTASSIARGLPDVPMNQLVERLVLLEARRLVSVEDGMYRLTAAGGELVDVLDALALFGMNRLLEGGASPGDAVLPHVLMRQLELRYDRARAASEGFAGRFELVLRDPERLWSVERGVPAPGRWALLARPDGLTVRAGACLDPDAVLRLTVDDCARLAAGDPVGEIRVDGGQAGRLLELLGAAAARVPIAA